MATELERLEQQLVNVKSKVKKSMDALQVAKDQAKQNKKREIELKRKIEKLESENQRKERTKRLIKAGAIIENIIGGKISLTKLENCPNILKSSLSVLKEEDKINSTDTIE